MGWRATLRSMEAQIRRVERDAERLQKYKSKVKIFNDAQNTVNAFEKYIQQITSIHVNCNSKKMNWEEEASKKPPHKSIRHNYHETEAKEKYSSFKPTLLQKIFKTEHEEREFLRRAVAKATIKDDEKYQRSLNHYQEEYILWEEKTYLATRLLEKYPQAYVDAVNSANPFTAIKELGSGVLCTLDNNNLIFNIDVHGDEIIPKEKYSVRQSGTLATKSMPKGEFNKLYQDYVCSCVLRIAHEVYALLPIDNMLVNANDDLLNTRTGHMEKQTILSVMVVRKTFEKLNLWNIDPSDAMKNFLHNMSFKQTTGFDIVEPLNIDSINGLSQIKEKSYLINNLDFLNTKLSWGHNWGHEH